MAFRQGGYCLWWDCSWLPACLLLPSPEQPCSWCSLTVSRAPQSSQVLPLYQQSQVDSETALDVVAVLPRPEVHKAMASSSAKLFLPHLNSPRPSFPLHQYPVLVLLSKLPHPYLVLFPSRFSSAASLKSVLPVF